VRDVRQGGGGEVDALLFFFPLFFLSSTEAAAGPLDIAARAVVEVLGFVSLFVGVMGVVEDMAGCGCDESWFGGAT
jgi:hypothetical protein